MMIDYACQLRCRSPVSCPASFSLSFRQLMITITPIRSLYLTAFQSQLAHLSSSIQRTYPSRRHSSMSPRRSKRSLSTQVTTPAAASATASSSATTADAPSLPPPLKKPRKASSSSSTKPTGSPKKASSSTSKATPKFAAYLQSPFPEYIRPSPEECQLVTDKLAAMHGLPVRPGEGVKKEVNGSVGEACGAVPSVLDALVRTILSQNTTNNNSSRAYASLLQTFGPASADQKRVVSLLKVHRSSVAELTEAIKCGGLANVKAKVIKNVLLQVRDKNYNSLTATDGQTPLIGPSDPSYASKDTSIKTEEAIKVEASSAPQMMVEMEKMEQEEDKDGVKAEVKQEDVPDLTSVKDEHETSTRLSDESEEKLLTLDYLHSFSDEDAMKTLESFKGVGPKTASCVLLFCLARDSFAVDTHVFRLSKQLGWVPPKATRETCYEHLDVRIPGPLKYPLHVLLIAHGKSCRRCAASNKTSRPSLGPCPLLGISDTFKPPKKTSSSTTSKLPASPSGSASSAGTDAEEAEDESSQDVGGVSEKKKNKKKEANMKPTSKKGPRVSNASTVGADTIQSVSDQDSDVDDDDDLTDLEDDQGLLENERLESGDHQGEVKRTMAQQLQQKEVEEAVAAAHGGLISQ